MSLSVYHRGKRCAKQGNYVDAIPLLEEATRDGTKGSTDVKKLLLLGSSLVMIGDHNRGIQVLEKALSLASSKSVRSQALYSLGYACNAKRDGRRNAIVMLLPVFDLL
jgi:tetratricopeptide (TPR) repeat protein